MQRPLRHHVEIEEQPGDRNALRLVEIACSQLVLRERPLARLDDASPARKAPEKVGLALFGVRPA